MSYKRYKLTTAGRKLLGKVLNGECKLNLVSLDIGSGSFTEDEIPELTALKNKTDSFKFRAVTDLNDDLGIHVLVIVTNRNATADYYWKETAVIAKDPDDGDIVFCAYCASDEGKKISAYDGTHTETFNEDILIAVNDESQITIDENTSEYLTKEEATRMFKKVVISSNEPTDTLNLWIDTTDGKNLLKFYDATNEIWQTVNGAWK